MTTTRTETALKAMPYAQARVIRKGNDMFLRSYNTLVAGVKDGWAFCNGLYSMTTRKHIGAFAKEVSAAYNVNIDFSTFKALANDGLKMDITTGEVVERD